MSKVTAKNATQKIADLVQESLSKLKEAESIADEYGLTFHFSPEYGMGGTYYGDGWDDSACEWENSDSESGWVSSSANC